MYKQLIKSYFEKSDYSNYWRVHGTNQIVVADIEDDVCNIYEDEKDCFESHVKSGIEDLFESKWDVQNILEYHFTNEELDFICKTYANSSIAEAINEMRKGRV